MADNQSVEFNAKDFAELNDEELEQVSGGRRRSEFDGLECKHCHLKTTYASWVRFFPQGSVVKVRCKTCGEESQYEF